MKDLKRQDIMPSRGPAPWVEGEPPHHEKCDDNADNEEEQSYFPFRGVLNHCKEDLKRHYHMNSLHDLIRQMNDFLIFPSIIHQVLLLDLQRDLTIFNWDVCFIGIRAL